MTLQVNGVALMVGKYYVVDRFTGPVSGPHESFRAAEIDRKQINISEDCAIGICEERTGGKLGFKSAR